MSWIGRVGLCFSFLFLVAAFDVPVEKSWGAPVVFVPPDKISRLLTPRAEVAAASRESVKPIAAMSARQDFSLVLRSPSADVRLAAVQGRPSAITRLAIFAAELPDLPETKAPLIQRLAGRESDLLMALAIAVIFFLAGWIFGAVYARRRERWRRGRLRF